MKKNHLGVSLLFIFFVGLIGCGGGSGASGAGGTTPTAAESISKAVDALKNGNVQEAKTNYDAALQAEPANTLAAFGAALARLILLSESAPSQGILAGLGQKEFKATMLVGSSSYLAFLDKANKATVNLDAFSGPFSGKITTRNDQFPNWNWVEIQKIRDQMKNAPQDQLDNLQAQEDALFQEEAKINCNVQTALLKVWNKTNLQRLIIKMPVSVQATRKNGEILESIQVKVGDVLEINNGLSNYCAGYTYTFVEGEKFPENFFYDSGSGTFSIQQISLQDGATIEIALNNVQLSQYEGDDFALNGSILDTVTVGPDKTAYFPFTQPFADVPQKTLRRILAKASTLKAADLQSYLAQYVPLLQEIIDLLAIADQANDFQFIIPKELFFGEKDVPINRTDLKATRAGMDFWMAGIYFADSWEFPLDIGGLYDDDGNQLVSQQALVDELNRFFVLKQENKIAAAQTLVTHGLQLALEAFDQLATSADGILDKSDQASAGYAELADAVKMAQNSLQQNQAFSYVNPVLNVDATVFFANPPSASQVDVDPFVLENGKITLVESFFEKILQGTADLKLANQYKSAFKSVNRVFSDTVFDEFQNFVTGGEVLNRK